MPHPKYELRVASLQRTYAAVPLETLVRLAAEGRLSPRDEVRAVGTEAWVPVTDVPALAAAMPMRGEVATEIEFELDAAGGGWTPLKRADDSAEATMDMAPMIDVTFLLLIFFMLTNSLANPSPMVVPEAVHGRGVTLEGEQLILIDENGRYYLGDEATPEARVETFERLLAEVQRNADALSGPLDVIVSAHKKTQHVRVRDLVEHLGEVDGLGRVMIGVKEKYR